MLKSDNGAGKPLRKVKIGISEIVKYFFERAQLAVVSERRKL